MTRTKSKQSYPAAVLAEGDPRAADIARVVPQKAEIVQIGSAVLGYRITPARIRRHLGLRELRIRELERLIEARCGKLRVETDDAALIAEIVADHAEPNVAARWIARVCPNLSADTISEVIGEAGDNPRWWRAEALGKALNLKWIERRELRIRTIRACDVSRAEARRRQREIKRRRDREQAAARRRAAGAKSRDDFQRTSVAEEARREGVAPSTIYRRRARCNGSVAHKKHNMGDAPVAFARFWFAAALALRRGPIMPGTPYPKWAVQVFTVTNLPPIPRAAPKRPPVSSSGRLG